MGGATRHGVRTWVLAVAVVVLLGGSMGLLAQPTLTYTVYQPPWPHALSGGGPAITTGSDGALWFSDWDRIGRVTTAGAFSAYPLPDDGVTYPSGRGVLGMAVGPGGALWFTEREASRVGSISQGGVITEHLLPASDRRPEKITAGPDGALWYTEFRDRVGRITTSGAVTEFTLPPCGATCTPHPAGITAGPNGVLWFTDAGDSRVKRMTPAGAITSYGPFVVQVGDIVVGPDGALWFTGPDTAGPNDHIGRITTTGAITAFPLPIYPRPTFNGYNNLSPSSITTGPDGALWFTATRVNVIGRITTGGQVTLYALPPAPGTDDVWVTRSITTGPDGALWITTRRAVVRAVVSMPSVIDVQVAIRPGGCTNPLNVRSKGVLPTAVLGAADLDVSTIDPSSVRLEGVAPLRWSLEDVDGPAGTLGDGAAPCTDTGPDGYGDLSLKFSTPAVVSRLLAPLVDGAPRVLTLTGTLKPEYGGTSIRGHDVVVLIAR